MHALRGTGTAPSLHDSHPHKASPMLTLGCQPSAPAARTRPWAIRGSRLGRNQGVVRAHFRGGQAVAARREHEAALGQPVQQPGPAAALRGLQRCLRFRALRLQRRQLLLRLGFKGYAPPSESGELPARQQHPCMGFSAASSFCTNNMSLSGLRLLPGTFETLTLLAAALRGLQHCQKSSCTATYPKQGEGSRVTAHMTALRGDKLTCPSEARHISCEERGSTPPCSARSRNGRQAATQGHQLLHLMCEGAAETHGHPQRSGSRKAGDEHAAKGVSAHHACIKTRHGISAPRRRAWCSAEAARRAAASIARSACSCATCASASSKAARLSASSPSIALPGGRSGRTWDIGLHPWLLPG